MSLAPIISLDQGSKSFGKSGAASAYVAVDRLDLQVARGQLLALLGKTGCGKSTIFNMIAGLTEPTSGTVTVAGSNPFREFDSFRGKMAIVFQGDRLLPWRTAVQNVELGLEMLDVPAAERRRVRCAGSARSASRGMSTTTRTRSPAGCASASRSHGRLPPTPISCSATSRSRHWTR